VGSARLRGRHGRAHQLGYRGIVGAYVIGKRIGWGKESMTPHNLPMTMIARRCCDRLVRFNAGSALEANGMRPRVINNTFLATACRFSRGSSSSDVQGQAVDAGRRFRRRAGLVAITPAAGNVGIPGAFVIGTARHHLPLACPVEEDAGEMRARDPPMADRRRRANHRPEHLLQPDTPPSR